jgi:anti-sigma-K factor RskA
MRFAALGVTAVALSALAACGAGGDETAVRKAVNGWIAAVTAHDNAGACDRSSTELRKRIERHLLGEATKGNCHTWAARWVSPAHPASHRDARITAIRIHKRHARVELTAPGVPSGWATLVKQNGDWRIDNF